MSNLARGTLLAMLLWTAGFAPSTAEAATELGQLCVKLNPLVDTIRLSLAVNEGPATMIAVNFRWRFLTEVQVVGAGTITDSLTPGSLDLGIAGSHNTVRFGGNKTCTLSATLNPPDFSGPWQYTCTGAAGAAFTASGTIGFVACTPEM